MRLSSLILLTTLAATALTVQASTGPAVAQDRRCYALEDELARLSSQGGGGSSAEARRWDDALRDAADRLRGAERHRQRAHCDGGGFLFSSPDPRLCGAIDRDIADIRAEMARLSRNRSIAMRRSGDRGTQARIAQVRQQLSALGCGARGFRANSRRDAPRSPGDGRTVYESGPGGRVYARPSPNRDGVVDDRPVARSDRGGGFFDMIFGNNRRYRDDDDGYYRNDAAPYGDGGTYRTLCVRSCDGFFFPISFSTTSDNFEKDAAQCQAMCPGTNAQLYVHHNPGEDASAMVSIDGARYSDLENAFLYRTEYVEGCSCKASNMSVAGPGAVNKSYYGGLSPVTGGDGGLSSLDQSGNDGTDGPNVWNPDEPWSSDEPWSPNDPWEGFRDGSQGRLVTKATPMPKLSADEDPDTVLNQRGDYAPKLARVEPPQTASADGKTGGGTQPAPSGAIRKVGPEFFVAQ